MRLIAASLLAVVTLAACAKMREREAIRRYARAMAKTTGKWKQARAREAGLPAIIETGDVERVRSFLKSRLLDSFTRYLKALRAVPTGTARLRAIHRLLVRALEESLEAYERYATHVTAATLQPDQALVREAAANLARAEKRYRREIAAYYEAHNFKVKN